MPEIDDFDLEDIPRARKGPPRWMIFTGCGCLLPGFVLVAVVAWGMEMFGGLAIQTKGWSALTLVLPYDDIARGTPTGLPDDPDTTQDESREPGEFELLFGGPIPFSGGVEVYWFGRDMPGPFVKERVYGADPLVITILKIKADQADAATIAPVGTPLHEDMTIEVQERPLRGRRIPEMISDKLLIRLPGLEEVRGAGAVVWLRESFGDPDQEDGRFDLLVFFQRPNSSRPIHDEEIRSFLAPFDLAAAQETSAASPEEGPEGTAEETEGQPEGQPEGETDDR